MYKKTTIKLLLISLISIVLLHLPAGLRAQNPKPSLGGQERLQAWEKHLIMKETSPYKEFKWEEAGPEFTGGRIESIAIHPDLPSVIFVAPGSGGIWKSINHGTTWKPVFDEQAVSAMGCVVFAPSDPGVLYAGTGEVLMARSSYSGLGVFRSDDGGETWNHAGLSETYHIPKIVVDPANPDIVYVAALGHNYTYNSERGIYKSTDGGKNWTKLLYVSEKTGFVDLVMDPSNSNILYAVSWERDRKAWNNIITGSESGIYRTTDAGATWELIGGGLPKGDNIGRMGLSISPSDPSIVYAIVDNRTPMEDGEGIVGGELYRSDDRGLTWKRTHEEKFPTGIGYDFCLVRVAPDNSDEVFVPGWKLVHSIDGGKTFSFTGDTVIHILKHDIRVMHLDMHEMQIDPNNPDRILLGNDGGLYCSWDRGNTWLHFNNFPAAEFYAVYADNNDPYIIYGGTQDNAAVFGPSTSRTRNRLTQFGVEDEWENVYLDRWGGGDSYFTYPDPDDKNVIFYEHQFGALRKKNMLTGETVSIQPKAPEGEDSYRYNWMTPFFFSSHKAGRLYYGTQRVLFSDDRGLTWNAISDDLSTRPGPEKQGNVPFGTITSMSESPLNPSILVVGTDDGNVQLTTDGGKTWRLVSADLPAKWVSRVVASRFSRDRIYLTMTGYRDDDFQSYIYMSENLGKKWTYIGEGIPDTPVNALIEDPENAGTLFAATDRSVYVTKNYGKSWSALSEGLPQCPVYDIFLQERERELIAATHGRGVYILSIKNMKQ